MRILPQRTRDGIAHDLRTTWQGRLDETAVQARVQMSQCDVLLLGHGALSLLVYVLVIAAWGLGTPLIVAVVVLTFPPLIVLRTYHRASRQMASAVARANGVPDDLAPLLDLRRGVAGLDRSVALLRSVAADAPAAPDPGTAVRTAREQRIARMWGHRLDAVGIRAVAVQTRWIGIGGSVLILASIVVPFLAPSVAVVTGGAAVLALLLVGWRVHRWTGFVHASVARALGLSPEQARGLPTIATLRSVDAAVDRAREAPHRDT